LSVFPGLSGSFSGGKRVDSPLQVHSKLGLPPWGTCTSKLYSFAPIVEQKGPIMTKPC
jgi:hypothetical protein